MRKDFKKQIHIKTKEVCACRAGLFSYAILLLCLCGKVIAHVLDGFELDGLVELEAKCSFDLHSQQHNGQRVQLEILHQAGFGGDGADVNAGIDSANDFGEFFDHEIILSLQCFDIGTAALMQSGVEILPLRHDLGVGFQIEIGFSILDLAA